MDIWKEALLKSKQLCAVKLTHIRFGTGLLQADTWSQGCIMEVRSRAPQYPPLSQAVFWAMFAGTLLPGESPQPHPVSRSSICPSLGTISVLGPRRTSLPDALRPSPWLSPIGVCAVLLPHCSREALTYLSFYNWEALHLSSNVSEEKEQGWSTALGLPGRSKKQIGL